MSNVTATFTPNTHALSKALAAVERGVNIGAEIVRAKAQEYVPIDTGELHDSIEALAAEQDRDRAGSGYARTALVVARADHAGYVEFGTGIAGAASAGAGEGPYNPNWAGMPAQPYLRPAIDDSQAEIEAAIKAELAEVLV